MDTYYDMCSMYSVQRATHAPAMAGTRTPNTEIEGLPYSA